MSERKVKIVKKADRRNSELVRKRRAALTMLEILCFEFPKEAERFVKKAINQKQQSETNSY